MNKDIQSQMKELFGHSCCAYCYIYLRLKTDNAKRLTSELFNAWELGYVRDDGFVSKPVQLLYSLGITVRDIQIVPIDSIKDMKKATIVEYKLSKDAKASHFVVVENGKVVFDPAGDSNTVKNGIPVSYRQFIY